MFTVMYRDLGKQAAGPLALLAALVCANVPPSKLCWAITLCLLCHTSSKHRGQFSPCWYRNPLQDPCLQIKAWLTALAHLSLVQTGTCKDKLRQLSLFSFSLNLYKLNVFTKTAKIPRAVSTARVSRRVKNFYNTLLYPSMCTRLMVSSIQYFRTLDDTARSAALTLHPSLGKRRL